MRLLWGTANLFSHRRYMAGAATNPDPEVFAYAAGAGEALPGRDHAARRRRTTCCGAGARATRRCSTPTSKRELDQLGRFLSLVVEHKHKIGFKGTILIEPKPQEPTKHQYDFDVATVLRLPRSATACEKEVKVNIEQNHAILAGHSFEHEIALAEALGIFGSIDINRGDDQLGWDTDQFPTNVPEMALALYEILQARRLHHRRHSISTPRCAASRSIPTI